MINTTKSVGDQAEKIAAAYLVKQRLKLVAQNIRSPFGEIDIIMRDNEDWVFVEVRYRRTDDYGGGIESITKAKRSKIVKTAKHFIQKHKENAFQSCRFDVVEVSGDLADPIINWIENAFID